MRTTLRPALLYMNHDSIAFNIPIYKLQPQIPDKTSRIIDGTRIVANPNPILQSILFS